MNKDSAQIPTSDMVDTFLIFLTNVVFKTLCKLIKHKKNLNENPETKTNLYYEK